MRVRTAPTPARAAAPSNNSVGRDGKAIRGPSLEVVLPSGLKLPNPFVIGECGEEGCACVYCGRRRGGRWRRKRSTKKQDVPLPHAHTFLCLPQPTHTNPASSLGSGPPGTNGAVICRAFDAGWGAVVAKTVSLDASLVRNVVPRYAKLKTPRGDLLGWENIELISDRPLSAMLDDFKMVKDKHPDRILIASIMEEPQRGKWEDLTAAVLATGVDALEINAGCPHGMPERRMGSALGQDPDLVQEVCSWVAAASPVPVWLKLTPNVTDIRQPAAAALAGGAKGLALINTINCIAGVDVRGSLRPLPTVEGATTPGGYSGPAVKPIALAKLAAVAPLAAAAGADVSGMGGIETGWDAAEFIALGSSCVQVCTGPMVHGYGMVDGLVADLQAFMTMHGFASLSDAVGVALPHVTLHSSLVKAQAAARKDAARGTKQQAMVARDDEWSGDDFVEQSDALVSNK